MLEWEIEERDIRFNGDKKQKQTKYKIKTILLGAYLKGYQLLSVTNT